jgi:hypothetical protein
MIKVKVLRDIEEIEGLERDWQRLHSACHGVVFSSYLWTTVWLKHFGAIAPPRVVTIWKGDELIGIGPFVSYKGSFKGYPLKYLCLAGNVGETTEYHDLTLLHAEDSPEINEAFIKSIGSISWNLLQLRDLRWDQFAISLYERMRQQWQCEEMVSKTCPRATLDASKDPIEQYETRSARKVKRIIDQLDKAGRIGFRTSKSGDQVSASIDTYLAHHKVRWASKGGSIYNDPAQAAFLKDISVSCAERGEAVVYEVLIDGKVASQQLCIREGKIMHMYKIGMDDQFRSYAPGYLSVYYAMNEARKDGYAEFDLGPGPEEYKYKVGGKDRFTHNIEGKRGGMLVLSKVGRMPGVRDLRKMAERKPDPGVQAPKAADKDEPKPRTDHPL